MVYYPISYYTHTHTMVRNTKGGKGAKSMARKSFGSAGTFPIPDSDMEHFAVVSKMYGPSCDVILLDGSKLLCHIRNKFKGRHKSGNLISLGSILLIGYRDWESQTNRKNCDLLFVYDNAQANSLADRFALPTIPNTSHTSASNDILFDDSISNTIDTLISTPDSNPTTNTIAFDFDDI